MKNELFGNSEQLDDTISRAAVVDTIEGVDWYHINRNGEMVHGANDNDHQAWYKAEDIYKAIERVPSAQPPKEISKRVLWSGWKGYRDTRYKCPNCEKPVRNDDAYCHRCGQRLLFPNISFTDYVPGQGHELIVRWDDEG